MSEVDFLVGKVVDEIRYSAPGNLSMVFEVGDGVVPALYATLGCSCVFVDSAGNTHNIEPDTPATVGPILISVNQRVDRVGTDDGTLDLAFSDGSRLRCAPDDRYEAWQVVGGFPEHLVVCTPGGELAVWDDQSEVETIRLSDLKPE